MVTNIYLSRSIYLDSADLAADSTQAPLEDHLDNLSWVNLEIYLEAMANFKSML